MNIAIQVLFSIYGMQHLLVTAVNNIMELSFITQLPAFTIRQDEVTTRLRFAIIIFPQFHVYG